MEIEKNPIIRELEKKVQEVHPLQGENKKELLDLFGKALIEINETKLRYLQLLELMADSDKEFNNLFQNATYTNFSECVDKFSTIGITRRKNKILREAFQNMGYRLMEQTRVGKRDEVFHNILRLYMTSKQTFDKELLIAFKQSNDEMFKVLIFSFLSGIIE